MKRAALWICLLFTASCSTRSGPPLTYLALERPTDPIRTTTHTPVDQRHRRGGWYFGNNNFRPAPDVAAYLLQVHEQTGEPVLRDADVSIEVPFAIDILFFGYNAASDQITAWEAEQ